MKNIVTLILSFFVLLFSKNSNAQNTFPSTGNAGIGTIAPNASSLLEMKSTSQGILIPRMATSQRDAIATPANGLLIYQTSSPSGFYYYNGTKWGAITANTAAGRTLNNLSAPTAINADLLPNANNIINLGSSALRYKDVNLYNLKFADGTLQTSAAKFYTAGTGISISGTTISSTLNSSQWTTSGSNIYYSNGNVGIGISSPTTGGLVVNTKAGAVNAMFGSNTTGVAIESLNPGIGLNTYYNGGRKFIAAGYGGLIGIDPTSGLMGFYNSASSGTASGAATLIADLAIAASGNIGIGTTTPTTGGLVVNTKAGAVNAMFGSNTTGVAIESSNPGIGLNTYYNNGRKFIAAGYGAVIGLDPASGLLGFYNSAASGAAGGAVATPADLVITAAGNVGIGKTAPAAKLDVNGDAFINSLTVGRGGGNIATNSVLGLDAFFANTTGNNNTAIGYTTLINNTTGFSNTAIGSQALYANTTGYSNMAIGGNALYSNISGHSNTASGYYALTYNTTGNYNVASGDAALYSNTTGNYNTANGTFSLYNNTTGENNTGNGSRALFFNTTGYGNIAIGANALYSNTTQSSNIAIGDSALYNNGINASVSYFGTDNIAIGAKALNINTTGFDNTSIGYYSLYANNEGYDNTAFGSVSLSSNTTGAYNTAIGESTLSGITTGNLNTACGSGALQTTVTGSNNTGLGYDVSIMNNYSGSTVIGSNATGTANSQVRVGDASITSIGGYVGWSNISDGRVKKNIKQNVPGLSFINKLNPVTYNLNLEAADNIIQRTALKDKSGNVIKPSQFETEARKAKEQIIYTGFIAQDVEKAAKSLNYDFSGIDAAKNSKDLYGLRYSDFVVPLVKAVQELSKMNDAKNASIDSLKAQNLQLSARLDKIEAMLASQISTPFSPLNKQTVELGSEAALSQNIPNPFTNSTVINYNLPVNNGNAFINFYSVNGTLLKSVKLAGNGKGTVTLKANELAAGIYHYTLFVDGKNVDSKQMISSK